MRYQNGKLMRESAEPYSRQRVSQKTTTYHPDEETDYVKKLKKKIDGKIKDDTILGL